MRVGDSSRRSEIIEISNCAFQFDWGFFLGEGGGCLGFFFAGGGVGGGHYCHYCYYFIVVVLLLLLLLFDTANHSTWAIMELLAYCHTLEVKVS